VRFDVFAEVVGAHEPLGADGADESLLARVRPNVPLQLVRSREAFTAEQPVAEERPFSGVPAQVRFEVRRLVVDLAAAGHVAAVHGSLAQLQRRGRTQTVGLLAVGTVARAAARVAPVRPRTGPGRRRAGRRGRPRRGGSHEPGQTAGGRRRRRRQKAGRKHRLVAVGHEARSHERRSVERFQRGRVLAGGGVMVTGREPVQHRAGTGVMVMMMMMIVLLLDPTGSRCSIGTAPPRGHVRYVRRHFLLHAYKHISRNFTV